MEGHQFWVKHKQGCGQRFILVLSQVAIQACCTARTDAGSDGVEPTSSFVIRSHQITNSMSCPMQTVSCAVKVYSSLRLVQWRRSHNPVKEQDPVVHGQMELPSISLQAIYLNPSCSK